MQYYTFIYYSYAMIIMRNGKMKWEEVSRYIKEARKDPEFRKDLKKFIDISTGKSK